MGAVVARNPTFGSYELLERIGVGGMGEVFRARCRDPLGKLREVALKRLRPEVSHESYFASMFADEARIVVQLDHPNIARVYEIGTVDNCPYIAMEYVGGKGLSEVMAASASQKLKMPLGVALRITVSVADALDYAHGVVDREGRRIKLVHRDIAPQNILISWEGDIKLIDFGIAKARGRQQETAGRIVKGKFAYMSPEQLNSGPIDGRSDIFSLGIVLYELVTGRHPFAAETALETMLRILNEQDVPPPPSAVTRATNGLLDDIVMKALRRQPSLRYQDIGEVRDDLVRLGSKEAAQLGSRQPLQDWMRQLFRPARRASSKPSTDDWTQVEDTNDTSTGVNPWTEWTDSTGAATKVTAKAWGAAREAPCGDAADGSDRAADAARTLPPLGHPVPEDEEETPIENHLGEPSPESVAHAGVAGRGPIGTMGVDGEALEEKMPAPEPFADPAPGRADGEVSREAREESPALPAGRNQSRNSLRRAKNSDSSRTEQHSGSPRVADSMIYRPRPKVGDRLTSDEVEAARTAEVPLGSAAEDDAVPSSVSADPVAHARTVRSVSPYLGEIFIEALPPDTPAVRGSNTQESQDPPVAKVANNVEEPVCADLTEQTKKPPKPRRVTEPSSEEELFRPIGVPARRHAARERRWSRLLVLLGVLMGVVAATALLNLL